MNTTLRGYFCSHPVGLGYAPYRRIFCEVIHFLRYLKANERTYCNRITTCFSSSRRTTAADTCIHAATIILKN